MPVSAMHRVTSVLASLDGTVEYSVVGRMGGRGEPLVTLMVDGLLRLVCQRCLEPIDWSLSVQGDYVLVLPGSEWPLGIDEDDYADVLETGPALEVFEFVEDEILLALPVAATHEGCVCPDSQDVVTDTVGRKEVLPFAELAVLKSSKGAPGAH